jgi:hypothetical protein
MKIDFKKNIITDGYGNWEIQEKINDCYIAKGFGNIKDGEYAYNIGFQDQHISVMRLLPHHLFDLSLAIINMIKNLPDDENIPKKIQKIKKQLKI